MKFPLKIDGDIELRLFAQNDAQILHELITHNRNHLDQWMRWSARVQTLENVHDFIQKASERYQAKEGFHVGLWYHGQLVGGIACRDINYESHHAEIGYWLGKEFVGKGLVTRCCQTVIRRLFEDEQMHRIEIQCVTDNVRSRAVAERLGFVFEGVRRESEWITSSFRDHALYSLLVHEWKAKPQT
jgi:ribosomal-protein-serine acetyltransferase